MDGLYDNSAHPPSEIEIIWFKRSSSADLEQTKDRTSPENQEKAGITCKLREFMKYLRIPITG
jgi:hypothetical protein